MEKRDNSFDSVRGLAMLTIMSWHVLGIHCALTDPWVMPVFFFIAGFFWKSDIPLRDFSVHKLKKLIKPLFYFSIPAFVMVCFDAYIQQDWHPFLKVISPYDSLVAGGWFIPCMLVSYLIYWMVDRCAEGSMFARIIITSILSVLGYLLDEVHIGDHRLVLPFYANTALFVMLFMEFGRDFKIWKNKCAMFNSPWMVLIICFIYVFMIMFLGSKPLDLIWCNYYNAYWGVVVLEGLCGILSILLLLKVVTPPISPLIYLGRQSLCVLLIHVYIIKIFSLVLNDYHWAIYISTVLTTYLTVKFIDRYMPFLLR